MAKIHVLPDQVANRIAAGEVVVRPAAVVKELVENALDAGASKIVVEIKKAGRELMRVIDNGCGMDPEDARRAFQRHATSKIVSDQDLLRLNTYGFRGEALPSIASVAMVELITCQKDAAEGVCVSSAGGEAFDIKPAAPVQGTQIDVANLFFNTPARRKFLKNDTTEFSHIMDVVINQSLTALSVHFELIHDGKIMFALPATDDLKQRIGDVYGNSLKEALFPVKSGSPLMRLRGLISRPHFMRSNRSLQRLFVNDRGVKDKAVSFAIQNAYSHILAGGRHAVCFLFLDLAGDAVDVNVHPTKEEIKFKDESSVKHMVQKAIKQALDAMAQNELVAKESAIGFKAIDLPVAQKTAVEESSQEEKPLVQEKAAQAIKDYYDKPAQATPFSAMRESSSYQFYQPHDDEDLKATIAVNDAPVESFGSQDKEEHLVDAAFFESKVLDPKRFFKVKNLFVVTEDAEGLVLVDQHAAQERVLYERFLNFVKSENKSVQELLIPLTLDVPKPDMLLVEALCPVLESMGFQLEAFGEDAYVVRSVPVFVRESEVVVIIHDILDDVRELGYEPQSLMKNFDEVIATMACRASIKAGDKVSDIELSHIFDELEACDDPHTCPHGRPTMIKLTFDELERKFRRVKS